MKARTTTIIDFTDYEQETILQVADLLTDIGVMMVDSLDDKVKENYEASAPLSDEQATALDTVCLNVGGEIVKGSEVQRMMRILYTMASTTPEIQSSFKY